MVHLGSGAAAAANGAKEALQGGGGAGDAEEGDRGTPDNMFEGNAGGFGSVPYAAETPISLAAIVSRACLVVCYTAS